MKSAALPFLHRARHLALRLLRVKTQGVKAMVFNPAGALLLIRNTYGRSDLFVLPGGGIDRGEAPIDAAAREVLEETGMRIEQVRALSTYQSGAEGRRDTIHLFTALSTDAPVADGVEVEEARFFPLDALPGNVSAATMRRIAEYRGTRPIDGRW